MFWTDNEWDRHVKWRLMLGPGVKTPVMVFPPYTIPKTRKQAGWSQHFRAFRLDEYGKALYLMCEAPTLEECQALAVTLYKMEEP